MPILAFSLQKAACSLGHIIMKPWSAKMISEFAKRAPAIQSTLPLHSTRRHYHMEKKRNFTVVVEGNIGSGKTSLLEYFKKFSDAQIVAEPVEKWRNVDGHNCLANFYENPSRWAITLQTYVQLTMLQAHEVQTEKPVKLMERSLFSAKYCFVENLHKSGTMHDLDYLVLTRWFDWILTNEKTDVDLIVYLQTKPEKLYERIKKRCRPEEQVIPLEYLKTLHDLHEKWLIHQTTFPLPAPVLVIDADSGIEDMMKKYEEHKDQILFRQPQLYMASRM